MKTRYQGFEVFYTEPVGWWWEGNKKFFTSLEAVKEDIDLYMNKSVVSSYDPTDVAPNHP